MFLATFVAGQCILVCRRSPKSLSIVESVIRRSCHTLQLLKEVAEAVGCDKLAR